MKFNLCAFMAFAMLALFTYETEARGRCAHLLIDNSGPEFQRVEQGPSTNARRLARASEVKNFKPRESRLVVPFDLDGEFNRLSQENLAWLLEQLQKKLPANDVNEAIDAELETLDFAALHRIDFSPGEVTDLEPTRNFFSRLTDRQSAVAFRWVGVRKDGGVRDLMGHLFSLSARLKPEFGAKHGLVIPEFTLPSKLIRFFYEWEPAALDDLIRAQRARLPSTVTNAADLVEMLSSDRDRFELIFSVDDPAPSLAPLTTRLSRYILSEADARAFSTELLRLYLRSQIASGARTEAAVIEEWRKPGGAGNLLKHALKEIKWEGMTLTVPLGVPKGQYTFIRMNDTLPPVGD